MISIKRHHIQGITTSRNSQQTIVRFLGKEIFVWSSSSELYWIRFFGVGMAWRSYSVFSERIGKKRMMKIGKWHFAFLKKSIA